MRVYEAVRVWNCLTTPNDKKGRLAVNCEICDHAGYCHALVMLTRKYTTETSEGIYKALQEAD